MIEFARNVLDLKGPHSAEFNPDTKHPVIMFMPEVSTTEMGGTMRLGGRVCKIAQNSLAHKLYGKVSITSINILCVRVFFRLK